MKTFWQFMENEISFQQFADKAPPEWKAALPAHANWHGFDFTPWLIYADWLEERGDPQAQQIRLKVQQFPQKVKALEKRMEALHDEDGGEFHVTEFAPEDVETALQLIWIDGNRDMIEFSHFDRASGMLSVSSAMDV
jgi:uncharacterized protein (TIGR02996 family)